MKRRQSSPNRRSFAPSGGAVRTQAPNTAPAGGHRPKAGPGWRARAALLHFSNPRVPSVPTTLDLRLDEYYAAAALMGLLASQADEPDQRWACDWAFQVGDIMTAEAQKRRRGRRKAETK